MRGTGNGKRETGNGEQGASHGERENEKWEQNRELEMKIPIGLRFQPRSQGSLLPVPTDSSRRENSGTRLMRFTLGFVPVFHFPIPRFSNVPKKSYLDNLFCQIQYVFPPLLRDH